jgi:DNA helicase-2/ATP-dependent DNA helicase PcrA
MASTRSSAQYCEEQRGSGVMRHHNQPEDIMPLSTDQLDAAHDPADIVRLVAGPGTGKTQSIEERTSWLLTQNVPATLIYVLSFTKFASEDLGKQIKKHCALVGLAAQSDAIQVSTAHSLALKMLRNAHLLTHFPVDPIVMDSWEAENIFASEFAVFARINGERANFIRNAYESSWNTLNVAPLQPITPIEQQAFTAFHPDFKQTYSCMLPGEMVKECLDHINSGIIDPIRLTNAAHLIVDEFQDLNQCDQDFIDKFAAGGAKLFVAGDDDQSLYSFRNAAPDGLINFTTRYPAASPRELPDCYRCTPAIVTHSLALVARNYPRLNKILTSVYERKTPILDGRLYSWKLLDGANEANAIACCCANLKAAGVPLDEILILVSSKPTQSPEIEAALSAAGVPFESPRGQALKDSQPGRLFLSLLRILVNDDDYLAYRTLLGLYPSIGPARCMQIRSLVRANNLNFKVLFINPLPAGVFTPTLSTSILSVARVRSTIRTWNPTDTLATRAKDIVSLIEGFLPPGSTLLAQCIAMWQEEIVSRLPSDSTLQEVLNYLRVERESEQEKILQSIFERLQIQNPAVVKPSRIRIMTIHGSKGLNSAFVFIPGLETGILPNKKSLTSPGLLAEQRRVLYVGLTRAKLAAILSFAIRRTGRQAKCLSKDWSVSLGPSQFLTELGVTVVDRNAGFTPAEAQQLFSEYQQL